MLMLRPRLFAPSDESIVIWVNRITGLANCAKCRFPSCYIRYGRPFGTQFGELNWSGCPTTPYRRTRGRGLIETNCSQDARVAKSADATDLKSVFPQGECGFKSRPGHHRLFGLYAKKRERPIPRAI